MVVVGEYIEAASGAFEGRLRKPGWPFFTGDVTVSEGLVFSGAPIMRKPVGRVCRSGSSSGTALRCCAGAEKEGSVLCVGGEGRGLAIPA